VSGTRGDLAEIRPRSGRDLAEIRPRSGRDPAEAFDGRGCDAQVAFGKPYAQFYIDDLAVSAFSDLHKARRLLPRLTT